MYTLFNLRENEKFKFFLWFSFLCMRLVDLIVSKWRCIQKYLSVHNEGILLQKDICIFIKYFIRVLDVLLSFPLECNELNLKFLFFEALSIKLKQYFFYF